MRAARPSASAILRRTVIAVAVLAVVAILCGGVAYLLASGRLDWPFPVRYSDGAFADAQLRPQLVVTLWAIAGAVVAGGALIVVGFLAYRLRVWMLAAGAAIVIGVVGYLSPHLTPLTVEAFPTTYYRSPTGYSAASIVQGAARYATHCASCHGRAGRGDGPAGRFLRVRSSDLTADHVYGHTDGDMYWWITNGIRDVMPDFGAALDANARWNVIDFVRANADAARLREAPAKVANVGYRAPGFARLCSGTSVGLQALRGRIVHLVIAASPERLRGLAQQDLGSDVSTVAVKPLSSCAQPDQDLTQALALYRGGAGPIEGTEFLIDGAGLIRAMWYPGGKPNWGVPDELEREIAAIRDNPAARRPRGTHHGR